MLCSSSSTDEDVETEYCDGDGIESRIAMAQLHRYKEIKKILGILADKLDSVCRSIDVQNKSIAHIKYRIRINRKKLKRIDRLDDKIEDLQTTDIRGKTILATITFAIGIIASAGIFTSLF